ncbi:KIF14 [Symbiodinium sp. CCMP2456]|nr:KIF14 [Symbiodinium sp. CCMP2456]
MEKTNNDETVFVGVRLRPFLGYEARQHCFTASRNVISVRAPDRKKTDFAFDCVMDSTDASKPNYVSQEKCYDMIGRRIVQHSISGYHACLFCYGQTGSGKTFSCMGKKSEAEQGLLPRLLQDLLSQMESLPSGQVHCRAQILEVYNEKLRDLLSDKDSAKAPEIHVHPRVGVYVDGAMDVQIDSMEQLQKVLDTGMSRASVASTARNPKSSRGHVIFRLLMEKHEEDHTVVSSELFCVDLAGRENEKTTKVTGENFVELTFINRSLMWLAQCIQALGRQARKRSSSGSSGALEGSSRARFRNSKLTLLLINALTGNSKTCLLATVSPAVVNLDESLVTLNFASTVKSIKVAARRAAKMDKDSLIQSLSDELQSLKEQLSKGTERNGQDLHSQAGLVRNMMESYKARWEEAQKNADMLRRQKDDALQNLAISRWKFAKATVKNELREESSHAGDQQASLQQANGDAQVKVANNVAGKQKRLASSDTAHACGANVSSACPAAAPPADGTWPNWTLGDGSLSAWLRTPSLVLYSKDPGFSGRLIFHVADEGRQYMLGCSPHCDFRLPKTMTSCSETFSAWQESGRLFIMQTRGIPPPCASIEVNGARLSPAEAKELLHQDLVVLNQTFRFVVFLQPDPAVQALLFGVGRGGTTEDPIGGILTASSCLPVESKDVFSPEDFLKRTLSARSLIQEAVALSKAFSPQLAFTYELLTLAPVPLHETSTQGTPDLYIRVLKAGKSPTEVALWDFRTFHDRLKLMRQAWQASSLRSDRPWVDTESTAAALGRQLSHPPRGELMYHIQRTPTISNSAVQVNSHPKGVVCLVSPRSVKPQRGLDGQACTQMSLSQAAFQSSVRKTCERLQSLASPTAYPGIHLCTEPVVPTAPSSSFSLTPIFEI